MKIDDLFLDEEALGQGLKVPVVGSDKNGNAVDEWISILFVHSDAAQAALAAAMRSDFESGSLTTDAMKDDRTMLKQYSYALVSGWSFETECTPENVKILFARSPDIRNNIISKTENKRLFFPKPAKRSSRGQKKKSNS